MNLKDLLDLFNSKFAFVAVIAFNMVFTMYWVNEFAPWNIDKRAIDTNITALTRITDDLTKIVNALNIRDGKQDVQISEIKARLDRELRSAP